MAVKAFQSLGRGAYKYLEETDRICFSFSPPPPPSFFLFHNFVKNLSQPLDVTGVTVKGSSSARERCYGAGGFPRVNYPTNPRRILGIRAFLIFFIIKTCIREIMWEPRRSPVRAIKSTFNVFIIKRQIFTKRSAKAGVKVKS